jgi:hypothetical protein
MSESERTMERTKAKARYQRNPEAQARRSYMRALKRIKQPRERTLEKWGLDNTFSDENFLTPGR